MEESECLTMPQDSVDKYIDSIELSNACRRFYQSRLETAQTLKEKWGNKTNDTISDNNGNERKKSSIDIAMEQLRKEMASLMDQDLSLMKQLLTLNEEIEDLKWRRRYCWSKGSFYASSCDTESRDWTESDMSIGRFGAELPSKYPSPSSLSLPRSESSMSFYDESNPMGTFNKKHVKDSVKRTVHKLQTGRSIEGESYDSGIHEGFMESQLPPPLVTHL